MDVHDSVRAIQHSETSLVEAFYDRFLADCPEALPFFDGTNMGMQTRVLRMALWTISARGNPAAEDYLRILGTKHKRLGVPQSLYPVWRDCLLTTLSEFHAADWTESLAEEWTKSIDVAIDLIGDGYREDFHV